MDRPGWGCSRSILPCPPSSSLLSLGSFATTHLPSLGQDTLARTGVRFPQIFNLGRAIGPDEEMDPGSGMDPPPSQRCNGSKI